MCLILTASTPERPLVVAANRDEWLHRAALPLARWDNGLFAGRDRVAGGTWMAVREDGAFAAVTNVREPGAPPGPRTRGELPMRVLGAPSLAEGIEEVARDGVLYSGFHVIAGSVDGRWHASNRGEAPRSLSPGLWGVSNGPSTAPWPKVVEGLAAVEAALAIDDEDRLVAALLEVLADRRVAADARLPETGVGIELERALSARFIRVGEYGTRCSTVLVVTWRRVRLVEQSHDPGGGRVDVEWGR